MKLLPARLPARLRPPAPPGSKLTPPALAGAPGPWLASQQLAPGVALRLRLRPQRLAAAGELGASPGCGWFDSSRDLRHGLEVCECECEALALPAADLGAGLEVFALL